jgi:hypothetical protein
MSEREKLGPDLASLIYGSIVTTLLDLVDSVDEVNKHLDAIGYRIGLRLAHEFASDRTANRAEPTPDTIISDIILNHWSWIVGPSSGQPPDAEKSGISSGWSNLRHPYSQNL